MTRVTIRPERPVDIPAIRSLNMAAFPTEAEANLVDMLRANGRASLSLVAVAAGEVVGHILFSPVTLEADRGRHPTLGLAPMAVRPALQRQGVGGRLVEAGLERCKQTGVGAVVVLGHEHYYPRFGFEPASGFGVTCEYDVPDQNFMLVELIDGASEHLSGVARYQPEFGSV